MPDITRDFFQKEDIATKDTIFYCNSSINEV